LFIFWLPPLGCDKRALIAELALDKCSGLAIGGWRKHCDELDVLSAVLGASASVVMFDPFTMVKGLIAALLLPLSIGAGLRLLQPVRCSGCRLAYVWC
jgi:hypothetical protein